jgi:hypothetical protein
MSMLGDLDKDCKTLWDMMQWCLKHNIHIHAAHIPGKKNCLADKLSRGQKLVRLTEWALKPSIVQHLQPDEFPSVHPNPTWMHLSTELCCVDIPAGVPL